MTFSGLKREFLLVHRLSIKLRQGISGAAKRGVHSPIHLIKARRYGLPFLPHIFPIPSLCDRQSFKLILAIDEKREFSPLIFYFSGFCREKN